MRIGLQYKLGNYLIDSSPISARECIYTPQRHDLFISSMDIQLYPPVGTCYFKSYTVKHTGKSITLIATFYVYVTNVKPTDPDFTAKGGKVYIFVVYNGSTNSTAFIHYFSLTDKSGLMTLMGQLPITGSGVKQGDDYLYTIDSSQVMSMFNNGGNTPYNFPARFKKTFSLRGYIQRSERNLGNGWSLFEDGNSFAPTINGLQIFETDRLAVVKCTLYGWSLEFPPATTTFQYDLDFSAETMAKAVVGGTDEHGGRTT